MALLASETLGDFAQIVKNTFIDVEFMPTCIAPRRSSVPPHARLCQGSNLDMRDSWLLSDNALSDVSTYDTDSESGYVAWADTEDVCQASADTSPPEVCMDSQTSCPSPAPLHAVPPPKPYTQLHPLSSKAVAFQPAASQVATSLRPRTRLCPLSSKAAAFRPQEVALICKSDNQHYRNDMAEVIRLTSDLIKQSEYLRDVEISEDRGAWSVVMQPKVLEEDSWQTEALIALARKALLEVAAKTKCIYVMGYCDSQPFSMRAQGFQATLGAMQNAATACWHMFKKGFCRHGDVCCKQHPIVEAPVHFLVEGVQVSPCARFAHSFKAQVADLALTVAAALAENPHVKDAKAIKDHESPGWTIEVMPEGELAGNQDYLLTLAKNVLFSGPGTPDHLCMIGYGAKPFVPKSCGFVVMIGEMHSQSRMCWDMYSRGFCSRAFGTCKFEHPECLMPVNIVVKEAFYQNCSTSGR